MSNWAELDDNNKVLRVLVGDNNEPDEGYQWLIDNLGGTWVQTSYNGKIRYNYAGIGYTYDPIDDAFIPPMPECNHDSLTLTPAKTWDCSECRTIIEAELNEAHSL
jgi:hypothetical protein